MWQHLKEWKHFKSGVGPCWATAPKSYSRAAAPESCSVWGSTSTPPGAWPKALPSKPNAPVRGGSSRLRKQPAAEARAMLAGCSPAAGAAKALSHRQLPRGFWAPRSAAFPQLFWDTTPNTDPQGAVRIKTSCGCFQMHSCQDSLKKLAIPFHNTSGKLQLLSSISA